MLEIYQVAAPALSVLAPDVYSRDHPTAVAHFDRYNKGDNPLMVVEIGNAVEFPRFFFYVFGNNGVGFSPFGMDFTGYANYPLGARAMNEETVERMVSSLIALRKAISRPASGSWRESGTGTRRTTA